MNLESRKLESFLKFGILLSAVVLINISLNKWDIGFRLDFTEDQRYSIQSATERILEDLDDVVYVEIYLEGDLPAGFRRLRNAVEEKLEQFQFYGGQNIRFKFIDPETANSDQAKNEFYRSLAERGIQPTNIFETKNGKRTQRLIFPGAIVSYGGIERPVTLLKGNRASGSQERLNQSIEGVEYELASAIRAMTSSGRKRIAILEGFGCLDSLDISGLTNALLGQYDVFKTSLNRPSALQTYDALIIPKPIEPFDDLDNYKIDQYIMNGGHVLFFLDLFNVKMDSVGEEGLLSLPLQLGLESSLFKYGVRINPQMVQDLNSGTYPVVTGNFGDQPQIGFLPWPFHPVVINFSDHPVTKNLDAVITRFVSPLDTVKAEGVIKTPLLFTSDYSRTLPSPVRVSFLDFQDPPGPELFQKKNIPVAYLLEGELSSAFKNRILPEGADKSSFKDKTSLGQIFIAADGDFVRNEISVETGNPLTLGAEQFSGTQYANAEFILNLLNYMLDENRLIEARTKEVELRPLDQIKLQEEKLFWQILNLGVPVALIVGFGLFKFFYRRNKYSKF